MRRQCKKCPWLKSVDPREIPGYREERHRSLSRTIAKAAELPKGPELRIMACHETPAGAEEPCVGWLHHQLGEGNNIALRLAVSMGRLDARYALRGEQWETFDETLPRLTAPERSS